MPGQDPQPETEDDAAIEAEAIARLTMIRSAAPPDAEGPSRAVVMTGVALAVLIASMLLLAAVVSGGAGG